VETTIEKSTGKNLKLERIDKFGIFYKVFYSFENKYYFAVEINDATRSMYKPQRLTYKEFVKNVPSAKEDIAQSILKTVSKPIKTKEIDKEIGNMEIKK